MKHILSFVPSAIFETLCIAAGYVDTRMFHHVDTGQFVCSASGMCSELYRPITPYDQLTVMLVAALVGAVILFGYHLVAYVMRKDRERLRQALAVNEAAQRSAGRAEAKAERPAYNYALGE